MFFANYRDTAIVFVRGSTSKMSGLALTSNMLSSHTCFRHVIKLHSRVLKKRTSAERTSDTIIYISIRQVALLA